MAWVSNGGKRIAPKGAILTVALLCLPVPALAQHTFAPGLFEQPASVRKLPPPKPNEDSTEIRCTYYADLMVRETQDGPESENAAIVRNAKAPCTADAVPGETLLDTAGMTFDGRKGAYLLFSDLDPHGATGFVIIDTKTGHILLRDAAMSHPVLQNLVLENGNLRLRYKRGVNAPCSLMQNAPTCWAQLVTEGLIPAELKAPSAQLCSDAYTRDSAPRNNPSIVVYATEIIIAAGGSTKVLSRGPLACESMP
jgi:hypothetical protein